MSDQLDLEQATSMIKEIFPDLENDLIHAYLYESGKLHLNGRGRRRSHY